VKARVGQSLLADTFFVEGELTSNGYYLTSNEARWRKKAETKIRA
jgi:hypothetical protein